MAAGMGSRYGGLKQIDPVGPGGEIIIDYSLYDAHKAGFDKVVFVIKKEIEKDFTDIIVPRIPSGMEYEFVFQNIDDLPRGYTKPDGRIKPWGTAHAVCAARDAVNSPFVVINADDYYGRDAFRVIYQYLSTVKPKDKYDFTMVAYELGNTLTENGYVSRGVCETDANDMLLSVTEHTHIEKDGDGARYTEDGGETWDELDRHSPVSMNLWGFTREFIDEAWAGVPRFLDRALSENPLKAEYYLPFAVDNAIKEGKGQVTVLESKDKWYGVTYSEDKQSVMDALAAMAEKGIYPKLR